MPTYSSSANPRTCDTSTPASRGPSASYTGRGVDPVAKPSTVSGSLRIRRAISSATRAPAASASGTMTTSATGQHLLRLEASADQGRAQCGGGRAGRQEVDALVQAQRAQERGGRCGGPQGPADVRDQPLAESGQPSAE